jgi:hypothetical protein
MYCNLIFLVQKVAEEYGIWMYALVLFLLTLWWAAHWGDASACPYIHLEAYLDGSIHFSQAFLASLAEIAGGLAIYKYLFLFFNPQTKIHICCAFLHFFLIIILDTYNIHGI